MLLLGHAAVSARRGPRGTCQETRAALWAPAECGVTARSASDGVDVNGIRVHHQRLQYRKYQCGMSAKVSPQILLRLRPRIVWADEGRGWWGALSRSLFRGFAAKPRAALGIEGDLVADPDGLEGYGCKREIVVGVVLFHKLIEAECHIDWNVQDLALFAEVLMA